MKSKPETTTPDLRPPGTVMRLNRMGCFHQTRLSFMRSLLRFLKDQRWRFERSLWDINSTGVGVAVYTASGNGRSYSLICFANDLPPEKRSDRVIAEEWDATFVLFDGHPSAQDIERLGANVPKQEAGHCSQSELVLSRANRSVRLFDHVVDSLSRGHQPQLEIVDSVGYLMRTTAVYGNGKFGISDRDRIADRPEFVAPFRAELLSVWLIRAFTVDIAEHLARAQGGRNAVALDPEIRRRLGVGNATGLGMAPFLVLHPALIHNWMLARETALARVRAIVRADKAKARIFTQLIARMTLGLDYWNTVDPRQRLRIDGLRKDLSRLGDYVDGGGLDQNHPWNKMVEWSGENLTVEGQELVVSLVIEPHGALVDDLAEQMSIDETTYFAIDGGWKISRLISDIEEIYDWALDIDFSDSETHSRFWYVSEEKLEPRLGERYQESGADKEHPLAFGRDISIAYEDLVSYRQQLQKDEAIAGFLLGHPQHRHAIRRVQVAARLPYGEIRDNLISAQMIPIDLLRCKLSFFGASKFDPKSDRWVRINMYQYAPFPDELDAMDADDWIYPPLDSY